MKILLDQAFCGEPHLLQISWFFLLAQAQASMILLQRPKTNSEFRSKYEITNICRSNLSVPYGSLVINLLEIWRSINSTNHQYCTNEQIIQQCQHKTMRLFLLGTESLKYYETRINEPPFSLDKKKIHLRNCVTDYAYRLLIGSAAHSNIDSLS